MAIEVLAVEAMSDDDLGELHELEHALHLEASPDDPFMTREAFLASQRIERTHLHRRRLLWREPAGHLVASALVNWRIGEENRHLARVNIEVGSAARRAGVGRALLQAAAAHASSDGRTLLQGWTISRIPAGEAFARAVGAGARSVYHENRLVLAAVDRDQLRQWADAGEKLADYEALWVEVPTPPELLEEAAEIAMVMNTAPRDDLDEHDETITPEMLDAWDRSLVASGRRQLRLYARHVPTGQLVGLTEMGWQVDDPSLLQQGDTGVLPEHRGRGLAKWLKAAMLLRVFVEVPAARAVATGNAMSNDAMLAINNALGFEPAGSWTTWELEVAKIL